jgi:hypothetical protein
MLFKIAERVGKTVGELTAGHPVPLETYEFNEWLAIFEMEQNAKDNEEQQ